MKRHKFAVVVYGLLMVSSAVAQTNLQVTDEGGFVSILSGERLVMRYKYHGVPYKPYVEQLCTPGGVNILRDSPADHKHHHGLMYAVTVNGVNFWEEQTAPGRQLHMRFKGIGAYGVGPPASDAGWFAEDLNWVGPDEALPMVTEERRVRVVADPTLGAILLTWNSRFARAERDAAPPAPAEIVLTGTKYHGLGMRFVESMDQGGTFFNADGGEGVQGTNDKRSVWCAYTATANGHVVTVAVFDAPDNPRHPATWFTMDTPFAYLSATLDLNREPFPLAAPATLRYGVAVWDGRQTTETVEKTYQHWMALEKESR